MRPMIFSGSGVARRAELRQQPDVLAAAFAHPEARFLPIWQSRCLLQDGQPGLCGRDALDGVPAGPEDVVFLGLRGSQALFAVALRGDSPPAGFASTDFLGLRELVSEVEAADAALLAYARAMILWRENHQHCGRCGAANRPAEGGFVMACSSIGCGHKTFPRLDPAVIVLVHRGERCLLGRQKTWPAGRFSTIAGFVEPGETLEDAVAREVHEETNVQVGDCRYLASQPWPFPAAIMLGFHAEGTTDAIQFNDGELVEARWLSREELTGGEVRLPPRVSIAYHLIEAWFDAVPGPRLAELKLDSSMFQRPSQPPDFR